MTKQFNLKITDEQHHQLKTLSAYAGLSMKEFMLSRVFAEAAETVFENRHKQKATQEKLQSLQENYFENSQIIVLSPEKWSELRDNLASSN